MELMSLSPEGNQHRTGENKLDRTVQRDEQTRLEMKKRCSERGGKKGTRRDEKETEEQGVLFTAGLSTLIQIRSPVLAMGDHIPGLMQAKVNDCKFIYECFSKNIGCLVDKIRVGQLADFFCGFILIT